MTNLKKEFWKLKKNIYYNSVDNIIQDTKETCDPKKIANIFAYKGSLFIRYVINDETREGLRKRFGEFPDCINYIFERTDNPGVIILWDKEDCDWFDRREFWHY